MLGNWLPKRDVQGDHPVGESWGNWRGMGMSDGLRLGLACKIQYYMDLSEE